MAEADDSLNAALADEITTHSINLLRVANNMRQPVLDELKRLEGTLVAQIATLPPDGSATQAARLKALLDQTQGSIAGAYQLIADNQGKALSKVAGAEQAKTNALVNGAIGVEVMSVAQTPEQLQALSSKLLLEGKLPKQWWGKQSADLQDKFATSMRDGVHRGEGIDALVARLRGTKEKGYSDGLMAVSRAQAETLVRTSVQTVANQARLMSYEKNQDVIKGVQWRATLDSRTSEICMALDGKVWSLPNYEPVGHDYPFPGPIAHFNCRSTQVAVMRSWDELSGPNAVKPPAGPPAPIDDVLREKLKARGVAPDKIEAIVAEKRGAMNGEPAPPVRFEDWLATKDDAFQNRLLGPQRAQLWREGKITLSQLVGKDLEPLSVQELHNMVAKGQSVPEKLPVEGQDGLSLLDRKLLQESLVHGVQSKEVMSHFVDLDTGARVTISGTSPSTDDLKAVEGFKRLGLIRNGLSSGEVFSPQEINLFGGLENFASARIVNPAGRVLTIALKPGKEFDLEDAHEVNELYDALGNTKQLSASSNKLAKAVRDHGSLSFKDLPVGTITVPDSTFNQTYPKFAKPTPFFDPEQIAKQKAAEAQAALEAQQKAEAEALALKQQAEADAAAKLAAQQKAEKEAARQEAADILIQDSEKKTDPLSVALWEMYQAQQERGEPMQPTEIVAAAQAKVKAEAEAKALAAKAKAEAEALAKQQAEAAAAAAKKLAEQQAAEAAKLAAEKAAADKLAAEQAAAAKAKKDAEDAAAALAAQKQKEADELAAKLKAEAAAAAAKAKADALAAKQKAEADAKEAAEKAAYQKAAAGCIAAYGPGSPANPATVNGIPFTTIPDEYWLKVKDVALPNEPAAPKLPAGKALSTGVVFLEDDGSLWIYAPTNEFGGYKNTFSKGRAEPDITLQQNALKEAYEELGLQGEITGYLGDFKGDVTTTRLYLGKRTGGEPWTGYLNGETDYVKLATPDQAKVLLNKDRDQKILEAIKAYQNPPPAGPLSSLVFVKTLPGSTQPSLMRDTKTGEEFVLKREPNNPGHVREEYYANQVYRTMGIAVPDQVLAEETDGPALLSKFIPDGQTYAKWSQTATAAEKAALIAEMQKGFVVDALLANYDVVGTGNDNIFVTPSGPVRLDNGGALRYRAQGAPKTAFGDSVTELDTMRDPKVNAYAGAVFKSIPQSEIRRQILDLLARRDDILAAVPADLRPRMAKRIDDLAKRLPPDTAAPTPGYYTDQEAAKVTQAKANGFSINGDRDQFAENGQLFWQETDTTGQPVTKAEIWLTKEASASLYQVLEGSLPAAERTTAYGAKLSAVPMTKAGSSPAYAPAAPTNSAGIIAATKTAPGDKFFAPLVVASKNINFHISDTKYNLAKLQDAVALKPTLEQYAKTGTAEQKAMAAQYLPVVAQIESALAAPLKSPMSPVVAYAPKVSAAPAAAAVATPTAAPVVPAVQVRQVPLSFDNAKRVDGELVQVAGTNHTQTAFATHHGGPLAAYEMDVGGVTIRFVPFQADAKNSGGYALQGQLEITTAGAPDKVNLQRVSDALKSLGLDNAPTSKEYLELAYLKRGFYNMKQETSAAYTGIVADASTTDADKIAKLKELARTLKVPAAQLKGAAYNPEGSLVNEAAGNGHQTFERWDLPRAKVEKEMADYGLMHTTSSDIPTLVQALFASGGEMTPTLQRLRKGISIANGMSPENDLDTGGANYYFTRIRQKKDWNAVGFYFKPGLLARQDVVTYQGDTFGNQKDPYVLNQRQNTIAEYKANAKRQVRDETIMRHGMSLPEEIAEIKVATSKDRLSVIDTFTKNGFAILPDGRKIEDVVKVA